MDQYEPVRSLPLSAVLSFLGVAEGWRERKAGSEWYGRCPVHQPKKNNNSFSFHVDGRFQCFSCGAKGKGAIDLAMAVRKVGFRDAVELLKGIDVSEVIQPAANVSPGAETETKTENEPFKATYSKFFIQSQWLSERGFLPRTLDVFGVGEYDNPKRSSAYKGKILLPVKRWKDDEVVAYLARTKEPVEGEPKYLFPKGFLKHLELFGCCQLRESRELPVRVGYIVESPFAVMKFWQMGLAAVSPFGWSLSQEQVDIARQLAKGWIYLPDKDKEEQVGKSVAMLSRVCWVKHPEFPEGCVDPETLTLEEIRGLS